MSEVGWHHLTGDDQRTLLADIRSGTATRGPYHVELHPSDRCNIDCFFCSTAALRGSDDIPLRDFADLVADLQRAGTRSVRLSGGGEPLFHRQIKPFLQMLIDARLPIENLTTNGVLLTDEIRNLLFQGCDQITLSLNTADPETYSQMMRTPARNFDRVVHNARTLIAERKQRRARTPALNVQYLVWKSNYRSIPRMYDLAREVGADTIFFNGLSFLSTKEQMSAAETDEMMSLYRDVVRRDGYRRITIVNSFEQDIRPQVKAMNEELHKERMNRSWFERLAHFADTHDFTLREKLAHRLHLWKTRDAEHDFGFQPSCLIGWYSMVVRTNGEVGPCCILQAKSLGNVYKQSVAEVWHGPGYNSFRQELLRIMKDQGSWQYSPERDRIVEPLCGGATANCPISTFYFSSDRRFMKGFAETVEALS